MSNLASLLQQACGAHSQGDFERAISVYQQALALDPTHAEANYGFGLALYDLARYPEARARFQVAADRNASYADAFFGLALVEKALSNYEESFRHLHNVRRIQPDYIDAIAVEGDLLERIGRKQQAYDLLAGFVDRGIVNTNLATAFAKVARHVSQEERGLAVMRAALAVPNLPLSHRRELHFELGNYLDAMCRYDEAWRHIVEANRLKGVVYNHELQKRIVDGIIEAFSEAKLAAYPRATNVSELPVFIVGMPRSGTSLVESVLASHPAVFGAGELDFMALFARTAPPRLAGARNTLELLQRMDVPAFDSIAGEYLSLLRSLGGDAAVRVTDKLPFNFFRLGLFALFFPRVRVIHVKRDPRDTALSVYFQNFTAQHNYAYDLQSIGLYYNEYLRLMEHWRKVNPLPMLEVQYETLVKSPEAEFPRIVEFCGLPWDDACLRFHATDRVTKTASYNQVRRPLYSSSVGRWRNYESHLLPLIQGLAGR